MNALVRWLRGRFGAQTSGTANPQNWLVNALGGSKTTAGTRVTEQTALQSPAVLAAIRVLAQDVSKVPIQMFRVRADGTKQERRSHPIPQLLRLGRPNPWQTPYEFKMQMMVNWGIHGISLAAITRRDERGRPLELVPLRSGQVLLLEAEDGDLFYQVSTTSATVASRLGGYMAIIPHTEVLRLMDISLSGLWGLSLVHLTRENIGVMLATKEHAGALFSNFADPGGILKHPGVLQEETAAKLRRQWEERYSGSQNRGKTVILEEGMDYQKLGLSNEDSQFVDTMRFATEETARTWRIPPHKLMDMSRSTFNNVEEMNLSYSDDTLVPIFTMMEDAIRATMMTETERRIFDIEFDLTKLVRGNAKARSDVYHNAILDGWMTRNEVRAREGMSPLDNLDEPLMPLNVTTADNPQPRPVTSGADGVPNGDASGPDDQDFAARTNKENGHAESWT